MTEIQEQSGFLPETNKIFSEVIKPRDIVVVVGPSYTMLNDPSLLMTSRLLDEKGTLYVVDPISRTSGQDISKIRAKLGIVTGTGDVDSYISEINSLRKAGLSFEEPKWLGAESGAQKIVLREGSVDVIVDHNTSVFLAGLPQVRSNPERSEVLYRIYRE